MPSNLTEYEKNFLKKIDNGHNFSEEEINEMFYDLEEIDSISEDLGRWTMSVSTIFKIGDRYIRLDWEKGLTEYQVDEYPEQPYEVFPKKETIVVTRWLTKKEN